MKALVKKYLYMGIGVLLGLEIYDLFIKKIPFNGVDFIARMITVIIVEVLFCLLDYKFNKDKYTK